MKKNILEGMTVLTFMWFYTGLFSVENKIHVIAVCTFLSVNHVLRLGPLDLTH